MRIPLPHPRPLAFSLLLTAAVGAAACRSAPLPPAPTPEVRAAAQSEPRERDVLLLGSSDFVTRARAGERLVAAGPAALEVLGRAASTGAAAPHDTAVIRSILEDAGDEDLRTSLTARWPAVRREAVEETGRRGSWSAIPRLLARMDDDDPGVRAAAAASLRRMTNQFFGYEASAPLMARRRAATRWREWWTVEGRLRTEATDAPTSG